MAFSPFIISKDVYGKILILDLYLLQIHFGFSSFSHPVNAVEACGLLTPLHIVPEWYFLCQYAMLKAVPQIKMQDSLSFILFYFMRRLSMSFYVKIKTSSRFNGFYRNPAGLPSFTIARVAPTRVAPTSVAPARVAAELGLPLAGLPRQGCPRQGDIALAGLPWQGSAPPHVAYSGIVHLLCDGPTHLVLFARWRGFVVLLYEVLFSCRAGLQVRRALSKFSIN